MIGFLKKVIGDPSQRQLKKMQKTVDEIEALESDIEKLSDDGLRQKTEEFKKRFEDGESLEKILPEAFAVVREGSKRVLNMRHYPVQLLGGIVLHEGNISEMKTGEGKTLVATLPVYLNAITGKGVHVVTVNEYLASRDAEMMGELYNFLGLTVGLNVSGLSKEEKREAYACDITYGTNNEFGFDYLRDNMVIYKEQMAQRSLHYALVDEVDSILIDEARTPLIISGSAEKSTKLYQVANSFARTLRKEDDYTYDEKTKNVQLTDGGVEKAEKAFNIENLYDSSNVQLNHHLNQALKAHVVMHRDTDYVVEDGEVVIVDQFTGRLMKGRRYSDGLHQAIEAKEGLMIQRESMTLASITFQNYFRMYEKLAGMTGTAKTEEEEFRNIYGMDVMVVPTNLPIVRDDRADLIFKTMEAKFKAVGIEIAELHQKGQPVLVGTVSIETSELLSSLLKKRGVKHHVLNAKNHEKEAEIIENAGQKGAVTIATNMAGRGTDIKLGDGVIEVGGLHVLGTERHESRRIDNQLRGRAGRQGDPGSSRFFLSMEDDLMRIFASERIRQFMQALGMEKGEAIEHKMVSNAIEKAQRKVEGRNFDIRKNLLEYDDVANDQRQVIYDQRNELMSSDDISETINAIRDEVIDNTISEHIAPESISETWDVPGLEKAIQSEFAIELPIQQWLDEDDKLHEEPLRRRIQEEIYARYQEKETVVGAETMRLFEKQVMLQVLDTLWKEHLQTMDLLRQGIHLRGYAQKNPKQEYKRESFQLFQNLLENIKKDVVRIISHVKVREPEDVEAIERQRREAAERQKMNFEHSQASAMQQGEQASDAPGSNEKQEPFVRDVPKVGRNEPCPCGSGKKYKQCHGKI